MMIICNIFRCDGMFPLSLCCKIRIHLFRLFQRKNKIKETSRLCSLRRHLQDYRDKRPAIKRETHKRKTPLSEFWGWKTPEGHKHTRGHQEIWISQMPCSSRCKRMILEQVPGTTTSWKEGAPLVASGKGTLVSLSIFKLWTDGQICLRKEHFYIMPSKRMSSRLMIHTVQKWSATY